MKKPLIIPADPAEMTTLDLLRLMISELRWYERFRVVPMAGMGSFYVAAAERHVERLAQAPEAPAKAPDVCEKCGGPWITDPTGLVDDCPKCGNSRA
jgi:hypothetical protein